jgi:hypothetical protein
LETAYEAQGGTMNSKERIIFLINNRNMKTKSGKTVLAHAPEPNIRDNRCYSIVVLKSALTNWAVFVHEIGHTLSLQHPFKMDESFMEGCSTNFMDYSVKPNMFWQWQWKKINNNDFK